MTLNQMIFFRDFINEHFKEIHQSPYSRSIYNQKVGWGVKPEGVFRVSDHWNFESHGKVHCVTHEEVEENTVSIGEYRNGKFYILKSEHLLPYNQLNFNEPVYTLFIDSKEHGRRAYIVKSLHGKRDRSFYDGEISGFSFFSTNK